MRKSAYAGLFALGIAFVISSPSRAQAQDLLQLETLAVTSNQPSVIATLATKSNEQAAQKAAAQKAQPPVETYTVVEGDSLNKIAETYKTTWQRLFYKNMSLADPDMIEVGSELVIPASEEVLAERPLPTPPAAAAPATQKARTSRTRTTSSRSTSMASSAGNRYTPGYCTWYAKNRRPDLPNNLGNANTWVARAAAQGIATGSAPRAGAIGQQGMHVVYVERVNGDGTVTISEMNYNGVFVISSRTVPAGTFRYIY